ncbi:MAG: tRNA (adenosine(37)-N6)-dimethylallyltransferase MiaA [Puniceicoccales bacterium]|jgi:tRNA dimethylallyltransferase|nr:tRNA (adenosine(37)-N6)-dimethylallyltransferase MiaA [Puniceicoccales bacterium]
MQDLFILTGYTATGKTELSLEIAEQMEAEIVSCDSLLVYKNLDIGTAKPIQRDLDRIKHHCINLVNPEENFDVSSYIEAARCAIGDIHSREKNALVVGGSGFYLKSFFYSVVDDVKITAEAENFVHNSLNFNGIGALVDKLLELNNGQVDIDLKNPRRVISALKRCLSTGKTLAEMHENFAQRKCKFDGFNRRTVLLTRDGDDLKQRVQWRIESMIAGSLIDEVRSLIDRGQFNGSNKNAIGYRETIRWLQANTTIDALMREIYSNTLKFIKKQKTWFKKQIPIDGIVNLSPISPKAAKELIMDVFRS